MSTSGEGSQRRLLRTRTSSSPETSPEAQSVETPFLYTLFEQPAAEDEAVKWDHNNTNFALAHDSGLNLSTRAVDIVAIHGINGHPKRTWTHVDNSDDGTKTATWLAESLPLSFPNSRVFSFGYPHLASTARAETSNELFMAKGLREIASDVLRQLMEKRPRPSDDEDLDTPIIFIGHDVGGLIIKELLYIANTTPQYINIAANTCLLIFFGTPQNGDLDAWMDMLFNIVLASGAIDNDEEYPQRGRRKMMDLLFRSGPTAFMSTTKRFECLRSQYKVISVTATKPTPFVGTVIPKQDGTAAGVRITKFEHRTDHLGLCKFAEDEESWLQNIYQFIKESADHLHVYDKSLPRFSVENFCNGLLFRRALTVLYPDMHKKKEALVEAQVPEQQNITSLIDISDCQDRFIHISGLSMRDNAIVSTAILENLRKDKCIILRFHFNALDSQSNSFEHLVLTWLGQLLFQIQTPFLHTSIAMRFKSIDRRQKWTVDELWKTFCEIIRELDLGRHTLICLADAIHESNGGDLGVVHYLTSKDFIAGAGTGLKVILTSRLGNDLPAFLPEHISISQDPRTKSWNRYRLNIQKGTNHNGTGSSTQVTSEAARTVQSTLESLKRSTSLRETQLSQIFPWIFVAGRPLTTTELSVVVALGEKPEEITSLNELRVRVARIRDSQVFKQNLTKNPYIPLRIDSFMQTHVGDGPVRDMLVALRLGTSAKDEDILSVSTLLKEYHAKATLTCLHYLKMSLVAQNNDASVELYNHSENDLPHPSLEDKLVLEKDEFLHYAIVNWAMHARQVFSGEQPSDALGVKEAALNFIQSDVLTESWLIQYLAFKQPSSTPLTGDRKKTQQPRDPKLYKFLTPNNKSRIEIAAFLGLFDLIPSFISSNGAGPQGTHLDTLAQAAKLAAQERHDVRQLIQELPMSVQKQICPDSKLQLKWELYMCALKTAVEVGDKEAVVNYFDPLAKAKQFLGDPWEKMLENALLAAAEFGHTSILRYFHEQKVTISNQLETLLHLASMEAHHDTVSFLLKNGDPEQLTKPNLGGYNALHLAVLEGHLPTVKALLKCPSGSFRRKINETTDDYRHSTALHIAAEYGHISVIKYLIKHGAQEALLTKDTRWEFTPLHLAAFVGNAHAVSELAQACDEAAYAKDDEGFTPFGMGIIRSQKSVIEALLDLRLSGELDPPIPSWSNMVGVHFAAMYGYAEIVEILLDRDSNPDAQSSNLDTPLHLCTKFPAIVKTLLSHDATCSLRNSDQLSPLDIAAGRGHTQSAKLLLKHIMETETDDDIEKQQKTALKKAVEADQVETWVLIMDSGAKLSEIPNESSGILKALGENFLRWIKIATDSNQVESIEALLKYGGNIVGENLRASETMRGLLFPSVANGKYDIVKSLINLKVDLSIPDRFGRFAHDVARDNAMRELLWPTTGNTYSKVEETTECGMIAEGFLGDSIWCDVCGGRIQDVLFYHCCSKIHNGYGTCYNGFDVCISCNDDGSLERCRKENHGFNRQFIGDNIMSFEQFCPNIRGFGVRPAK